MDFSLSLLPDLQPILGGAFALNLAYIGLPRFRYREKIRIHVRQKLDEIKDPPANIRETAWYQQVARLAALGNNDGMEEEAKKNKKKKASMPSEIWTKTYTWYFEYHQDRYIVFFLALICFSLSSIGVAHEIEYMGSLINIFNKDIIGYWFWFTIVSAAIPVITVFTGRYVVRSACQYSDRQIKDLARQFQKGAQEAELPQIGTSPEPVAIDGNHS